MSQSARIMFVIDSDEISRQGHTEFVRYVRQFLRRDLEMDKALDLASIGDLTPAAITTFNPDFIVPMGNKSLRYFMGEDVDLDTLHSIPEMSVIYNCCVMGIFNPASGMFNSEIQAKCAYGFIHLRMILEGQIGIYESIRDLHPHTNYREDQRSTLLGSDVVGMDTEGYDDDPWMVTTSVVPGHAKMIKVGGRVFLPRETKVVMHSALHDLDVLARMGIPIADDQFDDTMLMAFCLGVEPQGLKALCLRHCGMRMDSFEDVCGGDTDMLAIDWLVKLSDWLKSPAGEDYAQTMPE